MTIPDFQLIILPLLEFAKDNQEHTIRDVINNIADTFKLTDKNKNEVLPCGSQNLIGNRVG